MWVRLTFKAADGDTARAYRRMVSPPLGNAQLEEQIDDRLKAMLRLIGSDHESPASEGNARNRLK